MKFLNWNKEKDTVKLKPNSNSYHALCKRNNSQGCSGSTNIGFKSYGSMRLYYSLYSL